MKTREKLTNCRRKGRNETGEREEINTAGEREKQSGRQIVELILLRYDEM